MMKNFFRNGSYFLFKKQGNLLSAALILMVTYAGSMVLGILRERVLVSYFYSCCKESLDVYYAAFRLPDMIFQLVVIGALSAAFIPVFSEELIKNESLAYKISSSVLSVLLLVYLFLGGLVFIFARQISDLITGGFTPSQIGLMVNLTRLMLIAQGFFIISNFLTAIIQVHQRFIIPAIAPLLYNLGIIIITIIFAPILGILAPAVGVIFGAFFHLLIQVPLSIKLGFSYKPIFDYKIQQVREVFRLMLPRTLGLAVYQLEATVAVFLATSLSSGSLTIFHLTQRLMDLPVRLFGTSIGQVSLPLLSSFKAKDDLQSFRETTASSLSEILYLSLPTMAAILVLRIPLVRIAYGAKTFPWQATLLTGRVVAIISLAIFSQSMVELLVRGFYALHNTKIPLVIATLCVGMNIFLSILFAFKFSLGILGLALATSISSFWQAFLLTVILEKKLKGIISKKIFSDWLKMVFSTLITAIVFWGVMKILDLFILDTTRTINLLTLTLISFSIGIFIYLFLTTNVLGLEEGKKFSGILKKLRRLKGALPSSSELIDGSTDSSA